MNEKVGDFNENERRRKAFASLGNIYHELAPGTHTFHICPKCEERASRRDKCYVCLMKELVE